MAFAFGRHFSEMAVIRQLAVAFAPPD